VYKYLNELKNFHLWSDETEAKVFDVYSKTQDMGKLTALFKTVMEDYMQLEEEDRFKVRFLVRAFNRFYSYMAQIVRTFDVELYKTYVFTELLFKLLPKNPHEKVDLTGKLALEHNKLSEGFSGSIVLEPTVEDKTLKGEKGGTGKQTEEKKDLLDNIIDKINIMYHGNFTEADRVIVETIYEAMKKEEKKLSKQAKNSDVNMFAQNIFPKIFEKIAQACYVQQMDSFAKLFEEQSFYNRVMEEMGKAMYFNLKNGQ
jgi:type I restriction enzyme R subunit